MAGSESGQQDNVRDTEITAQTQNYADVVIDVRSSMVAQRRFKNYALSKLKSDSFIKQNDNESMWETTRTRLNKFFKTSISFLLFSIVFYSVVTYMIDGQNDIYFSKFADKYGIITQIFVDNLLYL